MEHTQKTEPDNISSSDKRVLLTKDRIILMSCSLVLHGCVATKNTGFGPSHSKVEMNSSLPKMMSFHWLQIVKNVMCDELRKINHTGKNGVSY